MAIYFLSTIIDLIYYMARRHINMAKTVNQAFEIFLRDVVNLDPDVTKAARRSRDNLIWNIADFNGKDSFFKLCSDFNEYFGSFARKTKCRQLDDIDLMIGLSACGSTYLQHNGYNDISITPSSELRSCVNDSGELNSILVLNKFKTKLQNLSDYRSSVLRRDHQAVTLNLISREWSFDVVPCFYTVPESDGRSYYLIPNGKGRWMKTDPTIDRSCVTEANKNNDGNLLEVIRLTKKWNKVKNATTIPSYLLETILVTYGKKYNFCTSSVKDSFISALVCIEKNIYRPVYDLKGIQGDINTLDSCDKVTLYEKAAIDVEKARNALKLEADGEHKQAIKKWGEIFGSTFPEYED